MICPVRIIWVNENHLPCFRHLDAHRELPSAVLLRCGQQVAYCDYFETAGVRTNEKRPDQEEGHKDSAAI